MGEYETPKNKGGGEEIKTYFQNKYTPQINA